MPISPEPGWATTQDGIYFQNCVGVLRLALMLGGEAAPSEWGPVASVRFEAPAEVDDVVVTSADGFTEYIQVKTSVEPGTQAWAKLWQHFYRQYQSLDAAGGPGGALTLAVRFSEPASQLAGVFERASSAETAQEWVARLTKPHAKFVEGLRRMLELDELKAFRFCRAVRVWQLNFERDPQRTDSFESEVRRLLQGKVQPLEHVFPALMELAADTGRRRRALTRDELQTYLARRNFRFANLDGGATLMASGSLLTDLPPPGPSIIFTCDRKEQSDRFERYFGHLNSERPSAPQVYFIPGELQRIMKGRPLGSSFRVLNAWKTITERRTLVTTYYVGLDVHKASICVAVINGAGKFVMESVVETSAATVLDFLKGLRGRVRGHLRGGHPRRLALRRAAQGKG